MDTNADDVAAGVKQVQHDVYGVRGGPTPAYNPVTRRDVRAGTYINAKTQNPAEYAAGIRAAGNFRPVDSVEHLVNTRTPWVRPGVPSSSSSSGIKPPLAPK